MCIVLKNQVTLQYVLQVPVNVVAWSFFLDAALPQENSSWLTKLVQREELLSLLNQSLSSRREPKS